MVAMVHLKNYTSQHPLQLKRALGSGYWSVGRSCWETSVGRTFKGI